MDPGIFRIGNKINEAVCDSLSRFNYKPKKSRIFIKPNIAGSYSPGSPYITDHRVVEGVIEYLQNIGIKDISIGEGPVTKNTRHVFRKSGYSRLCEKTGVSLIDLYSTDRKTFNSNGWKFSIPKIALESEYINISKLKTHINTGVTLCLKNQKGLLTLTEKRAGHKNLHKNIANIYSFIKPDLSIVDATTGLEGNGPGAFGRPVRNLDLIVIGTNALAVDSLSAMLIGMDPYKIKHLNIASGKREISFDDETIKMLEENSRRFRQPSDHLRMLNIYYWTTDRTCSGCTCALADLKEEIKRKPILWPQIFYSGVMRRADLLSGDAAKPKKHGKIICMGKCTESLARKEGLAWIPGCPPKPEEILKKLI